MTKLDNLKKILTHPNTLTLYRIASIPLFVILMLSDGKVATIAAAILFSAASITDYLDGYLARKWGLITNLGKVMDPLADKLLVSSAFIMLCAHNWIPAWIVCLIIGRELAVTGLRNMIADKGDDLSASWLGKYKTVFQISAIIPLIIHYPYFGINFDAIGAVLLWIALFFTVWSGVDYFYKHRNLLTY